MIIAVQVGDDGLHQDSSVIQPNRPSLQQRLAGVGDLVEVGVVPHRTVQHSRAGGSSNINRGARARTLLRSVPGHDAGVRERRAGGETCGNLSPELYVDGLPWLQRTVRCGVVCRYYRTHDTDTGG